MRLYVRKWAGGLSSTAIALLCLALLASACQGQAAAPGGATNATATGPGLSPSQSTPEVTDSPLPAPNERCGSGRSPARAVWFAATDGTRLDGATVGTGTDGVVLAHQYPADLCGWWTFAHYLARKGFLVLAFDFRCFGLSTCPRDAPGTLTDDVAGALAEIRRQGATTVALAGASLGGTVTLMAASSLTPPPDAVVCLSGVPDLGYLVGSTRLDAQTAVPRMTSPALFMVAHDDRAVSVADMRSLYRAAGSKEKKLVVLPASYGHGWNMVSTFSGDLTPAATTVLDFLQSHDRG